MSDCHSLPLNDGSKPMEAEDVACFYSHTTFFVSIFMVAGEIF